MPSYDLENLCNRESARIGMDARIDGMVYASIEHPPVLGGKVKSYDDKEALKVKRSAPNARARSVQAAAQLSSRSAASR